MTDLLWRWHAGDTGAFHALIETAYEPLRRIARRQARGERGGHTLQPTAIVHETILRLMNVNRLEWVNRSQFYAVAAAMMRRILVDYAREQNRRKRGGGAVHVSLETVSSRLATEGGHPLDLVQLDLALHRLAAREPRLAQVVELRFFGGLTGAEIARTLDISTATVQREWRRARTWLYLDLRGESVGG